MIYITTFVALSHSLSVVPRLTSSPQEAAASQARPRKAASSRTASQDPADVLQSLQGSQRARTETHLITPGVKVHHQVLGFRVPVANLALVAVWVPGHLLGDIAILLVLLQQLVVLAGQLRPGLQGRPQHNGRLAWPRDGRRSGDGAVPRYGRIVLNTEQRVGRIKVVVMDRTGGGFGGGDGVRGDTT